MLAARGLARSDAAQDGVRWLLDAQEADGSWFGRWGANYVYGTGAAVPALVAAGIDPTSLPIRRAVRWLHGDQNADGGWGEDLRSYDDASWRGRGASTASQTAWALLALLAAGDESEAVDRGIEWLVDTQREDGGWDEELYTGTGFPGDFYINYEMYRPGVPAQRSRALPRRLGVVTAVNELLVVTALRSEYAALAGQVPGARVARCGMGPKRVRTWLPQLAELAAARGRGRRRRPAGSTRRCGPATSWSPARCATTSGAPSCGRPRRWWPSCARMGLRVHTGPMVSTDHIVSGSEREQLAAHRRARGRHGVLRGRPGAADPGPADRGGAGHRRHRVHAAESARHRARRGEGATGAAPDRPGAAALGRPGRPAVGAARRAALVLRRRRPRDRHRRAGTAALSRARSTCGARSCTTRTSWPICSGRARCSSTSSTRCPTARPWCSPPTAWPPRSGRRPSGATSPSSTPPARWSRRCTPRRGGSSARGDTVLLIGHDGHDETEGTLGEAPGQIRLVQNAAEAGARRGRRPRSRCRT